jgi:hypothetical protein
MTKAVDLIIKLSQECDGHQRFLTTCALYEVLGGFMSPEVLKPLKDNLNYRSHSGEAIP